MPGRRGPRSRAWATGGVLALATVAALPAAAELLLPPGFTLQTHVTGHGFAPSAERAVAGIPSTSTIGVDPTGALYLAKTGARFRSGEVEDLFPIYRIPPAGATVAMESESRYFYGPPLRNPQVGAVGGPGEVLVSTYDRDRNVGALYRLAAGRAHLLAGGTPLGGEPLLRHPEGAAVDARGHVYVADRARGLVLRLDRDGRVLDPRHASIGRVRALASSESGRLWIGSDGSAEQPWQDGQGQLWAVEPDGTVRLVLEGPLPAGLSLSPGGALFVAQRRTARIFAVTPDGTRVDFAAASEGTLIRGLAFVPVTPETRRAGLAGDLFVILVRRQFWLVNEVARISGPFDEFVRHHHR